MREPNPRVDRDRDCATADNCASSRNQGSEKTGPVPRRSQQPKPSAGSTERPTPRGGPARPGDRPVCWYQIDRQEPEKRFDVSFLSSGSASGNRTQDYSEGCVKQQQ